MIQSSTTTSSNPTLFSRSFLPQPSTQLCRSQDQEICVSSSNVTWDRAITDQHASAGEMESEQCSISCMPYANMDGQVCSRLQTCLLIAHRHSRPILRRAGTGRAGLRRLESAHLPNHHTFQSLPNESRTLGWPITAPLSVDHCAESSTACLPVWVTC